MSKGTPDRTCPRCGHINTANALYCFQCGRDLAEQATVVNAEVVEPTEDRQAEAAETEEKIES